MKGLIRAAAAALLTASLGGCIAFVDTQVDCAKVTCPAGQTCDPTSRVCVPVAGSIGSTGSTASSSGSTGSASTASSSGGSSGTTSGSGSTSGASTGSSGSSSSSSGTSGSTGSTGGTCAADGDCGAGSYCDTLRHTCMGLCPPGQACAPTQLCDPYGRCQVDCALAGSQCPGGATCDANNSRICLASGCIGGCGTGRVCDPFFGACIAACDPDSGAGCNPGTGYCDPRTLLCRAPCIANSDCGSAAEHCEADNRCYPNTCTTVASCPAGAYCDATGCHPLKATGVACTNDGQCTSSLCAGNCCDCAGVDRACVASCSSASSANCTFSAGTHCGPTGCAPDGGALVQGLCGADGACAGTGAQGCGDYLCQGGSCLSSCSGPADCAAQAICAGSSGAQVCCQAPTTVNVNSATGRDSPCCGDAALPCRTLHAALDQLSQYRAQRSQSAAFTLVLGPASTAWPVESGGTYVVPSGVTIQAPGISFSDPNTSPLFSLSDPSGGVILEGTPGKSARVGFDSSGQVTDQKPIQVSGGATLLLADAQVMGKAIGIQVTEATLSLGEGVLVGTTNDGTSNWQLSGSNAVGVSCSGSTASPGRVDDAFFPALGAPPTLGGISHIALWIQSGCGLSVTQGIQLGAFDSNGTCMQDISGNLGDPTGLQVEQGALAVSIVNGQFRCLEQVGLQSYSSVDTTLQSTSFVHLGDGLKVEPSDPAASPQATVSDCTFGEAPDAGACAYRVKTGISLGGKATATLDQTVLTCATRGLRLELNSSPTLTMRGGYLHANQTGMEAYSGSAYLEGVEVLGNDVGIAATAKGPLTIGMDGGTLSCNSYAGAPGTTINPGADLFAMPIIGGGTATFVSQYTGWDHLDSNGQPPVCSDIDGGTCPDGVDIILGTSLQQTITNAVMAFPSCP